MKQTSTIYSTFSGFFSNSRGHSETRNLNGNQNVSPWVVKNILAYSAALFVVETKNIGHQSLLMN